MRDLDAIQTRADAAIPGPWAVDNDPQTAYPVVRADGHGVAGCPTSGLGKWPGLPNAEHIAGMNPQTTLALVAELRAAREAKQRLVKVLEYASYPDPDLEALRRIMAEWDEALDKVAGGEG